MKIKVATTIEIEAAFLEVKAEVRYWEDATVDGQEDDEGRLIPCKDDPFWHPVINLETGIITDWPEGVNAKIHYKVCDAGKYFLLDADKKRVANLVDEYVPECLQIDDDGYGDYILLTVTSGQINKWEPPTFGPGELKLITEG